MNIKTPFLVAAILSASLAMALPAAGAVAIEPPLGYVRVGDTLKLTAIVPAGAAAAVPVYQWTLEEGGKSGSLAPAKGASTVYTPPEVKEGTLFHVRATRVDDTRDTTVVTVRVYPNLGMPELLRATLMPTVMGHDWGLNNTPDMDLRMTAEELWPQAGAAAMETFRSMRFLDCPELPPALDDYNRRLIVATGEGLYALAPLLPKAAKNRMIALPGTQANGPEMVAVRPPTSFKANPFLAAFVGADPKDKDGGHRVYVLGKADGKVRLLAGADGSRPWKDTQVEAGGAVFGRLVGIAMDRNGNVYVNDRRRLWRISTDGVTTLYAGGTGSIISTVFWDGAGDWAQFIALGEMALDPANDVLYVVDLNTIRQVTPKGDIGDVKTILGDRDGPPKPPPAEDAKAGWQWWWALGLSGAPEDLQVLGDYLLLASGDAKPAILAFNLRKRTLENLVDAAHPGRDPRPGPLRHFKPEASKAEAADLGRVPTCLAVDSQGSCYAVIAAPYKNNDPTRGEDGCNRTLAHLDLAPMGAPAPGAAPAAAAPKK